MIGNFVTREIWSLNYSWPKLAPHSQELQHPWEAKHYKILDGQTDRLVEQMLSGHKKRENGMITNRIKKTLYMISYTFINF